MVEKPTRRFGNGRGTLLKVWKWSRDPPKGPEVVGGHSRRSGSVWGTLPEVRKCSGTLLKIRGPSQRSGSGRGTFPQVRK